MEARRLAFGGSWEGGAAALGGLSRSAHLRERSEALLARPDARVLALWRGLVPLEEKNRLCLIAPHHPMLGDAAAERIFLGMSGRAPVFAADLSSWEPAIGDAFEGGDVAHPNLGPKQRFCDLRAEMAALTPIEGELAATARALFEWHRSHLFCSRCGARNIMATAGWERHCPNCDAQHFPRTDPVVIMLVLHGNSVLIGRSPGWPEGMYSLLAGFVEPGETIESAVRREVEEETGVRIGGVDYLASQPWPFPASLMIGCRAIAEGREIHIDPEEIEDARWFTREEMLAAFAGGPTQVRPPRAGSIANFILWNWLAGKPMGRK